MRRAQLAAQPLCEFCLAGDVVTEATVADHVTPHKGDVALFFDPANLQSLCKAHHDGTKQRMENGRGAFLYGPDGWPL